MAGIKISELPEASCVVGDELVAIVQDSCTKFVAASAIGATGDSTITSVIAGCGLQGGGSFGAVTINMDANCLGKYDGTTSTVRSTSACWDSAYTTVQASSACWASGGGGGGGISTANAGLSTDGSTVGINSGTLTPFDQSSCPGIDCVGTVTGFDAAGDGITVDDSDPTSIVVEVDNTVVRTSGTQIVGGCKNFTGNILSAGTDLNDLFGSGGGGGSGVDTGTACRITRYNTGGSNVEDSNILDSSTVVTVDVNTVITGDLSAGEVVFGGNNNRMGTSSEILTGSNNFIIGGDANTLAESSTELSHVGIVGGTRNIINGGCNNVIIGGEKNCLCCNTTDASFTGNAIVGSLTACIGGECSGIYSSVDSTVAGSGSVVIGGNGHVTNCSKAYVFGGINNEINGDNSAIIGGCCNCAGGFTNSIATAVGGMCNCSVGDRAITLGGCRNSVGSDDAAIIGGCNNTTSGGAHQSVIAGGNNNVISSSDCFSFIGGGSTNRVCQDYSAIIGGSNNTTTECNSFIAGGGLNQILGAGSYSIVLGGCSNIVCHNSSVIAGGTSITSVSGCMLHTESLQIKSLPNTDPGVAGVIYHDGSDVKVSDDNVTISDTAGTASTFIASSNLFFSLSDVTYGPASASFTGNYHKPDLADADEFSVAFYSDANAIEIKVERANSLLQVFIDDVPVHEYPVGGYSNRLLKLTHDTAKNRKYELRGKNWGFGGVYTDTNSESYVIWPYETRRERPLLAVMTDSYGTGANDVYGLSFVEKLADHLDMDLFSDSLASTGWSSTLGGLTTTRAASLTAISRTPDVIVAALGYNDKSSPNQTNIENGINNWHTAVTSAFGSAAIMYVSPWTPVGEEANLTTVSGYISGRAAALGADFIDINGFITSDSSSIYTSDDSTHPNQAGSRISCSAY